MTAQTGSYSPDHSHREKITKLMDIILDNCK